MARPRERDEQRALAAERIGLLFAQAGGCAASSDYEGASLRVRRAVALALRCNVRLKGDVRQLFCRRCGAYFSSDAVRCRLNPRQRRLERTCLRCGSVRYHPYGGASPQGCAATSAAR